MRIRKALTENITYRTATAKTNCRKRRVQLVMTSGRGWLLELETVEDGFLLKRENAMAPARGGEVVKPAIGPFRVEL